MSKSTHALTVLAAPELAVAKDDFKKLETAAGAQCGAISMLERKAAAGAILAGLTLHRVKSNLPYGKFGGWIDQKLTKLTSWTPGTAKVNASYYMRLSIAFVEKVRADKSMLLALPRDGDSLELGTGKDAKRLSGALEKFIGDLSLNELLIKHGIKGVGLKTALTAGGADTGGDEPLTPAQQAEQAFLTLWTSAQEIHAALTDPNRMQQLTDAAKIEQLKAELVESTKLVNERLSTLRKN
jgi:hypothetical protein